MRESRHSTDHVSSGDRFTVKDYGLGQEKECEVAMPGMPKGGNGILRKANAISPASADWDIGKMSPRKINRRDLSRLYGLDSVPDYIYESIMRADMDKATELEMIILDEYMAGKRAEIRSKKASLGIEGGGTRSSIGRAAENILNVTYNLEKHREDEDHE